MNNHTRAPRLVTVILFTLIAGCGGGGGPGDTYVSATKLMEQGEAKKSMEFIHLSTEVQAMVSPEKMQAMVADGAGKVADKGGIEKIEILEESENGPTAVVRSKITYGNGETEEDTTKMIKIDGAWKIKIEL